MADEARRLCRGGSGGGTGKGEIVGKSHARRPGDRRRGKPSRSKSRIGALSRTARPIRESGQLRGGGRSSGAATRRLDNDPAAPGRPGADRTRLQSTPAAPRKREPSAGARRPVGPRLPARGLRHRAYTARRRGGRMRIETMLPLDDWRAVGAAAEAAEAAGSTASPPPRSRTILHSRWPSRPSPPAGCGSALPSRWRFAQPDDHGQPGLGPAKPVGRALCARIGPQDPRPQRAPLQRCVERAGAAAGGVVGALRAIWRAWEHRERLRFEGEHYRFTDDPEFSRQRPACLPYPSSCRRRPGMLRHGRPRL